MRVIQLSAKPDPDGVLRLSIPVGSAGGEFEVAVVLHPKPAANGPARSEAPEELGWPPGYFEKTYGSIQDPAFEAPSRGPTRPVEPLD